MAAPPTAPPAVKPRIVVHQAGFSLSSTQWSAAVLVTKARNQAVSPHGLTMDYHKMLKIFGPNKMHIDWRLQMAAGFRQAGGKINGIDSYQNKMVEAKRKQIYGNRKPLHAMATASGTVSPLDSPRKGRSGNAVVNSNYSYKYYKSCETIDLEYYWGACVADMGFFGKFLSKDPRIDVTAYIIAAGCGLVAGDITRQASKSDVGAVYLKTYKQEAYQPYNGGTRHYIETHLLPQ